MSKRYTIHHLKINHVHNQVCLGFTSKKPISQHTIVDLSSRQWNRYKSNSILVEDIIIDNTDKRNPLVSYNKITYGRNVIIKMKKITSLGEMLHYKEPSIGNIKGGFVFVTTKKKDILTLNKDTLIVDGSNQIFLIISVTQTKHTIHLELWF